MIQYVGCLIEWSSIQMEIALSTVKAEDKALPQALRGVILLMTLIKELSNIYPLYISKPSFFSKSGKTNNHLLQ